MSKITNLFTRADQVCDKIPVVSTVSNLTDLFQKCVMRFISQQTVDGNAYLSHLQKKNSLRCFSLLFPIVGNIGCLIYDLFFQKTSPNSTPSSTPRLDRTPPENREFTEEHPQTIRSEQETIAFGQGANEDENFEGNATKVTTDSSDCSGITPPRSESNPSPVDPSYTPKKLELQGNTPPPPLPEEHALSSCRSNAFTSPPLSQEEILNQLTQETYPYLLGNTDKTLRRDATFIRAVMRKIGGPALAYADPILTTDPTFMLNVIERDGGAFIYAGRDLRKNRSFMLDAVERNHLAFVCFDKETKNSAEFRKQAQEKNPDVVRHFLITGFTQNDLPTENPIHPKAVS